MAGPTIATLAQTRALTLPPMDGALNYRPERVLESYYSYNLNKWSWLTFDYQFAADPGYNADGGPIHIFASRLHAQF
jgi:high affinity Mn2+ porin